MEGVEEDSPYDADMLATSPPKNRKLFGYDWAKGTANQMMTKFNRICFPVSFNTRKYSEIIIYGS
jgi:hypothetical protein